MIKIILPLILVGASLCSDGSGRFCGMRTATLTASQSVELYYIAGRIDGVWDDLGDGLNNIVLGVIVAPDGMVFARGSFDYLSDGATSMNRLGMWDGSTWTQIAATWTGGGPGAMAIGPDNNLYVGGSFTAVAGTTAGGVAMYNRATGAWSAVGAGVTGANHAASGIAFGPDGALYVVGDFTTAGSVAAANAAKWDGSAWSALGAGLSGGDGLDVVVASDGTVYASGEFTTAGTVAASKIAKWNGSAWSALGAGLTGGVGGPVCYSLAIDSADQVYAGGIFTTAGTVAANYVARWNGSAWFDMAGGANQAIWSLNWVDGLLYAGGQFNQIGGLTLVDRSATWNGTSWRPLDIALPGSGIVYSATGSNTRLYLGLYNEGTAYASWTSGSSSPITNNGTARAYPRFAINRSGGTSATLERISNLTTGQVIQFNYPLANGETVVIDTKPGGKSVTSSAFGNMLSKVLPGSDLATFCLVPGVNNIALYVSTAGSPTISGQMQWEERYDTADGS